jgi:hypothetical protein
MRKDILVLLKIGFREEEILRMSRGKIRSYDKAYDELSNPKREGVKQKVRKKKPRGRG